MRASTILHGAMAAWLAIGFGEAAKPGSDATKKPNFIFIMTDDQDLHLDSLDYQPVVKEQFMEKGTWFKKHFCTIAICCPSRVSLLTGKAAHNTNVTDVKPPYGGYPKFLAEGFNDKYLPVWLQAGGYQTYYVGKLMNGHSTSTYNKPFAAGWTRSEFFIDPGTYIFYNTTYALDNGEYDYRPGQYSTDVAANRSVEFLDDAMTSDEPFFLGIAPVAPHSETVTGLPGSSLFLPPVPADRHKDLFPDAKVPRGPSFNPDQPGSVNYLAKLPQLTDEQVSYNDDWYRLRVQSLQSVDDLIRHVIAKLETRPDILDNTYIFYTTDNGFHMGQHRLPPGKTCAIEEDINIPFFVRGPGVAAGRAVSFPTSHTDIVPTLFDLAGIPLHDDFDGVPIPITGKAQCAKRHKPEHVNIEFWGPGLVEGTVYQDIAKMLDPNTYKSLRVVGDEYDFSYTVWCTNEHELYDMKADPFQMHNLYASNATTANLPIPELTARLDGLLLTLKSCKGASCREPWKTLFPSGEVDSLRDALHPKYDHFFMAEQEAVTFSACLAGYLTEGEGALAPMPYPASIDL